MEKDSSHFSLIGGHVWPNNLTELQKQYYPTIQWLVDSGSCGTGRTHLLALAYIEKAIINEGSWIIIRDHTPILQEDRRLMHVIMHMTRSNKHLRVSAKENPAQIRIEHALDVQVTER